MFLKDLKIEKNIQIKKNNFMMTFRDKEMAKATKMGNFLEIKAGNGIENLLRKPISINDVNGDEITVIYRVVGKGTKSLAQYKAGDIISVMGPLGNSFPQIDDKEVLIVAGGIGCGPFSLVMRNIPKWKLFYGFRDACEFLLEDKVKQYETEGKAYVTTDNGTYGKKAYITEELENYLKKDNKNKVIFCCGPTPMMKVVRGIAKKYNVVSYLSLEEYMGCGIGVCAGCVQKVVNLEKENGWENKKVCVDGPIFTGEELIWE